MVTHMGTGLVFRSQPRLHPNGADSSAPQFLGLPFIYACTFCRRTTKFDVVTHMGRGLVIRGSATPPSKGGRAPALPNFGFCSVYDYTQHRTPTFHKVTHVEEGRVSWCQPHLPSQKSRVPALSSFCRSPVFKPTPFNAEQPNSVQ